jgi:hypothetical protein
VVIDPQPIRPLPGKLDNTLVFNSNSPEVVQTEGILLSTFPGSGKKVPEAHLNQLFQGQFELFAHHIAKATSPTDLKTLYLGILVHNPGTTPVTLNVLQAASYLSQPDAPFIKLDPLVENPDGSIYAGPGGRVMGDILRGRRQEGWPAQLVIPPGESRMLLNVPIPVKELDPPINGRSTLARLRSNGGVYLASLAMFAKTNADGSERAPTLEEWQTLLDTSNVAGPRDKTPSVPGAAGPLIYGRVAGVGQGAIWRGLLVDANRYTLAIPSPGAAFSYPLSTVAQGTLGTGQVQSAPLLKRYPDTAYAAHGNYGIQYQLTLPLLNDSDAERQVTVVMQTAVKTDQKLEGLQFKEPPPERVFFRGTVRVKYPNVQNTPLTRYFHLVQFQGQRGQPLVTLTMPPKSQRLVQVDFLYPPDATPPQVLTVSTVRP